MRQATQIGWATGPNGSHHSTSRTEKDTVMSYSIIGFGAIGQALARAFARNNIEVAVASRRSPEALLPQAQAIGSTVIPKTLQEALKADVIFLAVLFEGHREVAKSLPSWQGKTVVDAMNGFEGLSSADVAKAFPGARLVKGFNHLPARTLAAAGSCSCRATTKPPQRKWRSWPNNWVSHPSISASSKRAARWYRCGTRTGRR